MSFSGNDLSNATLESELLITVNVSKDLEPGPGPITEKTDPESQDSMCRINIELSSYTSLQDVEVNLQVYKPLAITEDFHLFPNLRK